MREPRARPRRFAAPLAAALAVLTSAGCGEGQPDSRAASGSFELDVTRATFPANQSVAESSTLRLRVENLGARDVPQLAVTVRTDPPGPGAAPAAFGQATDDAGAASPDRPVWIVDRGPRGGDTAYTSTWAVGPLPRGAARSLEWRLTAVRPGRYTVRWRLAPALAGDAQLTGDGRTAGAFRVTIADAPVSARVGDEGQVARGAATAR